MPTRPTQHRPAHYQSRQEFDRKRNPLKNKTYDAVWRRLRDLHLQTNPLCAHCLRENKLTAAEQVHHIVPIRTAPERRLDPTNLLSLCAPCHSRITAHDVGFVQRGQ
jgi:5-methylcytosine-specific restriction enzyme A